ncbi:MAG: hypothetical protein WAQ53_00095 [Thiofilum sp.]|uniref:hypothetical protein n=1 Tax=Thiofilum sp. TaxID=2212733 RepID=UPI0025F1482A|nr:hypothetical protein [Thiofilum sp.]
MAGKTLIRIMYSLIGIGLIMIVVGISLILFTDIHIKQGVQGIMLIAGLIAGGLFLSLPAKLYLTLQLMRMNDEHLREQRAKGEIH